MNLATVIKFVDKITMEGGLKSASWPVRRIGSQLLSRIDMSRPSSQGEERVRERGHRFYAS